MSDQFFKQPILNSPYDYPSRHWELDDKGQYRGALATSTVGEALALTVRRGEQEQKISVAPAAFGEREAAGLAASRWGIGVSFGRGVSVASVRQGSPAARLGLAPGDVLVQIGGEKLGSQADFTRAVYVNRLNRTILVMIERGGRGYYAKMGVE